MKSFCAGTEKITSAPPYSSNISVYILASKFLSFLCIILGFTSYFGWIFDITLFKTILPGTVPISSTSSLLFILTGTSLFLSQTRTQYRWAVTCSWLCALFISIIGSLTLYEYISGISLGIDSFFLQKEIPIALPFLGRMSFLSAINFILIGIALILRATPSPAIYLLVQILLLVESAISLFVLIGYSYGSSSINTSFGLYKPMSLLSSFTFIVISISSFFSRPTAGFMSLITNETESGIMVRRTIGVVIITTFFLGWITMLGHLTGLYDVAMGFSLLIVLIMIILSIMVWAVGLSLYHIECKRMRIEKELEEQKDFSCGLIQNSTAPTFVLDTSHRVILWNKACEELTGIKGYELINTRDQWKAFYEYKRPCLADIIIDGRFKDLAQFYTIYGNSPILHDGLHGEGWFRNLGGRKRYIVFDAAPVYNVKGELISSVETLQDMTERKRMEEALIKSEERYRELIQNMPVGLYRNTPGSEGKFIMANPSMARLFGFESTEEFIAMKVSDLYEEPVKRKELSDKLIAEGKIVNEEIRFKKRGGTVFWGAVTAKTVRNQFGEIEYFDGMLEDITERKHIEELKNDFVALVSHQLKTPAAELKGYLYNLLSGVAGELNTKQREYIEDMYEISSKEYRLVTDLLNVSRLERGVFSVNIKLIVLQEIAGLAISNNINFAQTKKINIQIKGNGKDIECLADKDKFVEALSNVIHNAIKFTNPEGSITLSISEDKTSGIITVRDTGIGMEETTLRRLFTKEQTLQGAPLAGGGAGLGLYIAKQFMLLQKGNITVQSELGKGSTFSFFIPLAPQSLTEKNKEDA